MMGSFQFWNYSWINQNLTINNLKLYKWKKWLILTLIPKFIDHSCCLLWNPVLYCYYMLCFMDRWWMSSGQCGCPWTAHCDWMITPEMCTVAVITHNHSRLPREHYYHSYHPCQVITPLSENKENRDALFCPNQLPGSDSNGEPFWSGIMVCNVCGCYVSFPPPVEPLTC